MSAPPNPIPPNVTALRVFSQHAHSPASSLLLFPYVHRSHSQREFKGCRFALCFGPEGTVNMYIDSKLLKPITSETMLCLSVIVSESWGNDIRRWFSLALQTFVYGQAGSGDETRKEFLLGGEACTPVNTDSLKTFSVLLRLTLSLSLSPSAIASFSIWANLWLWYHTVWRTHCRYDGLPLKCDSSSIFYRGRLALCRVIAWFAEHQVWILVYFLQKPEPWEAGQTVSRTGFGLFV